MVSMLERARVIADDVLFPAALDVDAEGVIPPSHLDLLAEEGFYGLVGGPEHGGPTVDVPSLVGIVETLCGGCLTTTFTWMQHHSVVRGLTRTLNAELRDRYLDAVIQGELRGGVAFAGAIPRPPRLWATATDGGWLLNGEAPFVSGWGIIDLLLISARDTAPRSGESGTAPRSGESGTAPRSGESGTAPWSGESGTAPRSGESPGAIVSGLVDAAAGGGLAVEELRLIAAQGSNTVRLCFVDYFLPTERVTAEISPAAFLAGMHVSSRLNGSLSMGIAGRCVRLLRDGGHSEVAARLDTEQSLVRTRLDRGLEDPETLPAARAAASEFAYRAAGALAVAVGSAGILHRQHAQRLVREAAFTLVAAGRPEIRNGLLELFARSPGC